MRFELTKMLRKTGSKIALLILAGVLILSCYLTVDVYWVNEQGVKEYGHAAVMKLRSAQKEWAGPLDEEKLSKALAEIHRIRSTPEAQSKDFSQNDIAYSWMQGFRAIRNLLTYSFASDFSSFDFYRAESVRVSELGNFYSNRTRLLKDWLNDKTGPAYYRFSTAEKEFLIRQYEAMDTPLQLDYMQGWLQLTQRLPMLIALCAIVLGYMVSGIFADEFRYHTDALLFTTIRGRKTAVWNKIKAGLLLVSAVYWAGISLYTLFTLIYFGADGANCYIQTDLSGWKSFYNITNLQRYALMVLLGYVGNLFFALLTMWISAKSKSAVFAVTVPFILIFMPSILENLDSLLITKLTSILPDRLLRIGEVLRYFDLLEISGKVIGAIPAIAVLYTVLTILLVPICYRQFSRTQVI